MYRDTVHQSLNPNILTTENTTHRSGFVNIIGNPNVGKSTLMNALVGERMSIITNKPQTTRHRILGIVSDENSQIIFSDTPGFILEPAYRMQEKMNRFVYEAFEDADVMVWVQDGTEAVALPDEHPLVRKLQRLECPLLLVFNKMDLLDEAKMETLRSEWSAQFPKAVVLFISALHGTQLEQLYQAIRQALPEGPAYYPKDQLTDRPERFFMSEIVRKHILEQYHQEIPYSCEVDIDSFKEDEEKDLVRIRALIYVARDSQKNILIGKGGMSMKKLGIAARQDMETFLEKKVHLELFVKVRDNWRDDDNLLKRFGYN